ncbi:rod shape-determining protein MreD [Deinococcus taeanensis]|uniref:rod shape-determining protein MreD n=1 Tax=Deinococcus taeanensis TaxID=2737050 RepID=UPI001CDBF184|nr:rod shape-determining protein MreD [Deinococcus taeanensis]UBV43556.1 rod shape-determining protein MreD [Deinococcus taeanensis]
MTQRNSGRWVRLALYLVLLVAAQGLLSRLADALGVPAPDLFLLTGVALASRSAPVPALVGAYGLGLLQDVLGGGVLGLHAAGVAGGALMALLVRRYLSDSGTLQALLSVLFGLLGEWLTFLILTYWLRTDLVTVDILRTVVPLLFVGTFVVSLVWDRLITWAFGPRSTVEDQLS